MSAAIRLLRGLVKFSVRVMQRLAGHQLKVETGWRPVSPILRWPVERIRRGPCCFISPADVSCLFHNHKQDDRQGYEDEHIIHGESPDLGSGMRDGLKAPRSRQPVSRRVTTEEDSNFKQPSRAPPISRPFYARIGGVGRATTASIVCQRALFKAAGHQEGHRRWQPSLSGGEVRLCFCSVEAASEQWWAVAVRWGSEW